MDEEELEQPSSKINVGSFFERVDSVDRVANRALSQSSSNLGIVNNQKLIIQSLSVSIEAMETKIRDIANYIIIEKKAEKDAAEDRKLEQEDLSLIHISEPTRLGMTSYAVFCLKKKIQ